MHSVIPFADGSDVMRTEKLCLQDKAMLTIVSLSVDNVLATTSPASTDRLQRLLNAVKAEMHPEGSLAMVVPHPWHDNASRLAGERS